jgi:hypothetical protein
MDDDRAGEPSSPVADADGDLARFVAMHVRQLYHDRGGAPLTEPLLQRRDFSVVALADVSGYSLLTNALRTRGNQGAEVLTQLLNPYFHFVIDILEKSGGDVVRGVRGIGRERDAVGIDRQDEVGYGGLLPPRVRRGADAPASMDASVSLSVSVCACVAYAD